MSDFKINSKIFVVVFILFQSFAGKALDLPALNSSTKTENIKLPESLNILFKQAGELAQQGANLEFFGVSTDNPKYKKSECHLIADSDSAESKIATNYLNSIANLIQSEVDTDMLLPNTIKDFQTNLVFANKDWQKLISQGFKSKSNLEPNPEPISSSVQDSNDSFGSNQGFNQDSSTAFVQNSSLGSFLFCQKVQRRNLSETRFDSFIFTNFTITFEYGFEN